MNQTTEKETTESKVEDFAYDLSLFPLPVGEVPPRVPEGEGHVYLWLGVSLRHTKGATINQIFPRTSPRS
ncbi:MAG: hypothetical protein ACKOB2_03015, partial [Solirubrobacterales bacterium]